ncbi:MAG: sensor histidine kinase [Alphaproteobacteria bacterium]
MARAELTSVTAGRARSRRFGFTPSDLIRSLLGKLILLLIVFVTVPVILYSEFRQADADKRALLLESARAQGRLIAESLRPLLEREGAASLPELNDAIVMLATNETGIKVLYHPAGGDGISGFFFVASEPPAATATLDQEREKLRERGVLGRLTESCEGEIPMALRHQTPRGREELLTSITPITTQAGCWAVITTHSTGEMLGTAIDQPYWKTIEVRVASWIYFAMAVFTIGLFFTIWRGLRRFRDMARGISAGRIEGPGFAAQNQVPELAFVAEEFDRMTGALRDSAENLRLAAEDNAHAFKTPIAIMRQSLEPLRRLVPEDHPRGRRALDVIEESIDRLDHLVASARRLDQAAAELLDSPRATVSLSDLLERMLAAYGDSFAGRRLSLTQVVAPKVVVRAGDDLVETVIENVIDNAIEASTEGGEIEVELLREDGWASLVVRDRGPGVADADLERIFERYVSLRQDPGGGGATADAVAADAVAADIEAGNAHLGIGLWVVRRNLQAIGGEIHAENRDGGGLAMVMRLPLAS